MKKIILLLLLNLFFFNVAIAESYYFKKCKLTEILDGDYLIDINNKVIHVKLKRTDGVSQEWVDKIELIEKDQVYSERITSRAKEDSYFVYYLDVNSKSVIKQTFRKDANDIFWPDGEKQQSYCENVKADWHQDEKEAELKRLENKKKEEIEKRKKELDEIKKKNKEKKEQRQKDANKHTISLIGKNWIKISKADSQSAEFLKDEFNIKASEICLPSGNFNILRQKINVVEIDHTPAYGLEEKVRFGITGTIECK